MDNNTKTNVTNEELREAFEGEKNTTKSKKEFSEKQLSIFLATGAVGLVSGIGLLIFALLGTPHGESGAKFPEIPSSKPTEQTYSLLTGMPLAEGEAQSAPTYCVQTPNGLDGGRPQVGLNEAGVIFEAIAEAGITRFAAIYQDPSSAVIGPIRSLRIYYLEWDTPFDCTIVHAGGADDALAAVRSGGYRNLDEDYNYMYRGTYGNRLWNNLFTTSDNLKRFNDNNGYTSSNIKGFARLMPEESERERIDGLIEEKLVITKPAEGNTSAYGTPTMGIGLRFGNEPSYNVNYYYNEETNTYARGYQTGRAHEVYDCPAESLGEKNPEEVCTLTQISPTVVVAMMVPERKAADGYHEDISAIGSGKVYIFQNGGVITGTWIKDSSEDQIRFLDDDRNEIKLAPGQTIISAVPEYGSVEF